jgi:hypothetical protein
VLTLHLTNLVTNFKPKEEALLWDISHDEIDITVHIAKWHALCVCVCVWGGGQRFRVPFSFIPKAFKNGTTKSDFANEVMELYLGRTLNKSTHTEALTRMQTTPTC